MTPTNTNIEITTVSGKKIVVQFSDTVCVYENGEVVEVESNSVVVGDMIPTKIRSERPTNITKYIETSPVYSCDEKLSRGVRFELNGLFGFAVGMYCCSSTTSSCEEIIFPPVKKKAFEKLKCFCIINNLPFDEEEHDGSDFILRVKSPLLAGTLRNECNVSAADKKVPDFTHEAPLEFIEGVLDGMMCENVVINEEKKALYWATFSEKLVVDAKKMLSYFGIFTFSRDWIMSKHKGDFVSLKTTYALMIKEEFAVEFAKNVPLTDEYAARVKKIRCDSVFIDRDCDGLYLDRVTRVEITH